MSAEEKEMKKDEEYEYEPVEPILQKVAGFLLACVAVMVALAFALFAGGCATTKIGTDNGAIRESNSYIIGGLESAVAEFDRGIARAEDYSRGIQDEIERLDYLFGQYEQKALRLRNEVDSLRAKIKDAEKTFADRVLPSGGVHYSSDSDADFAN